MRTEWELNTKSHLDRPTSWYKARLCEIRYPCGDRSAGEHNLSGESLFQDRVRERDLDNFLVEELYSSDTFRIWLVARLNHSFVPPKPG